MNIDITNYPVSSKTLISSKKQKLNRTPQYAFITNEKPNKTQSVNFTGLPTFLMKRQTREGIRDYISRTGYYLGASPKKIREEFSIKTLADSAVLYRLTEKYRNSGSNFLNSDKAYESVANVYNKIKQPTMELNGILKISRKSLDDFGRIFDAIGDDKNKLKLFYQLNSLKAKNGSKLSIRTDDYINILSSDNAKKLSKNFKKYRSYLELNHRNDDFSEKLLQELELSKPSFSEKEIQKKLEFRSARNNSLILDYLPKKFLEENFNPLSYKLFGNFECAKNNLLPNPENITEKDLEIFKYIMNTTTKRNFNERAYFFNNDINIQMSKNTNDEIIELFKRIDSDKNFKKLYNKMADARFIQEIPIREFLLYADTFCAKNLLKNADNFSRILKYPSNNDRTPENIIKLISKNLNNKFYITRYEIQSAIENEYFTRNKYLFTGDLRANFQRFKRIFKHGTLSKIFGTGKEIPLDMQVLQPKIDTANLAKAERARFLEELSAKKYTESHHKVGQIPTQKTIAEPVIAEKPTEKTLAIETPIDKIVSPVAENTIEAKETVKPQKIKIKRDYKAEKLQIKQEAQDIIKAKIRSKKDYSAGIKHFTKMKNSFLADMFESVKDTRSYQRSQGIKKPTVSNKDVITLYEKINGKNKKLVKYFLNSRTSDGNREFNVRQISNLLDEIKAKRPATKTINNNNNQ